MIHALIQRARRRLLCNEMLSAVAIGASLAMGSVILLLLLGTQLLDWRVLAVIAVVAFGVILYRILRRLPPPYRVAVLIDSRANLSDALSTALYFEDPARPVATSASTRAAQRTYAERLISGVDLRQAVPLAIPRALYAMGALGLIASSLFALRYGIDHRLDLQRPLTTMLMDTWGFNSEGDPRAHLNLKKNDSRKKPDLLSKLGIALPDADQKRAGDLDAAPDSALDSVGAPDANNEKAESAKAAPGKSDTQEKMEGDQNSPDAEGGEGAAAGKDSADNSGGSQEGAPQGEQAAGKPASSGDNSSLLSKLRDAVSNMFSKTKPQSATAGSQKGSKQGQPNGKEKGTPGQGQQGGAQESAESQEGQQSGDSQNAQNANGKGNGKSADQQAAAQPGSGIGKQDGDKDLKNAEQLAAMGKLSEIIGKRSAHVTGEMTVEVQSGPQQLHTAYSQHSAKHGESSGEISRDEVPVALQSYVQQYFEQVRKTKK